MIACCDAAGVIYFERRLPKDLTLLPIARGPAKKVREFMQAKARHAYDGKTLLVPGVPEAEDQTAGLEALKKFKGWIRAHAPKGVTV